MIVKREWTETKYSGLKWRDCYGYFLFGFLPLYINKSKWS